jgi:hypothetical protein
MESPLAIALFLVLVNERLVSWFIEPLFTKFSVDTDWLKYVALVSGGVIVFLSGVNLFVAYMPDPLVGRVLTSIVAGGGSNLLYDTFAAARRTSR